MTHIFKCRICSRELSVSDKVFDERIAGKRVSVKCKHCNAPLAEDATSQHNLATSVGAEVSSPERQPLPVAKHVPGAVRAASHPVATKPAAPQRGAAQSDPTHAAPAKPGTVTNAGRTLKPSVVTAQTTPAKLSLAPVTAPPRPRHEEPPAAQDGNRTRAAAAPRASATSAAEQPSSTAVAPASPRIATRPPVPVRANALNDSQKIAAATSLSSKPPLPAVPIAPMRIVSIGRGPASNESPVATAPSSSSPPTALVSASHAESCQPSSQSPVSSGARHSENEMTPSAVMLAPVVELPQLSQTDMRTAALNRFSKRKGVRRMIMLGSAAAVLIVAIPLGLGMFKKGSPLRLANALAPCTAVRAITQSTGASKPPELVPVATVADAPAVPTVGSPAAGPVTSPSEKTSSVVSPSSSVATTPNFTANDDTIPDYISKPTLILVTDVAIRRAQRCHPHGHATGSARLFMTFAPNGHVSDVRIEGEPLASAPVAGCILGHARSIRIAKFDGEPFTYAKSITMR